MGETKIEWTDYTFNPWWGCLKVSPGCQHCYAETLSKRTGRDIWGPTAQRWRTSEDNWREPLRWQRKAAADGERRKVFCASMADVFESRPQNDELHRWRVDLWALIAQCPDLDWLLLTKRPENVNRMVPSNWLAHAWPANVWVGTSVESQEYADKRIPALLGVPAALRFLSMEPLLGPVSIWPWISNPSIVAAQMGSNRPLIDWVIVGGESGHHARPMDIFWARAIRDACDLAEVPFFFKQLGGTRDKGGALEQIPPDLRIRQFPNA